MMGCTNTADVIPRYATSLILLKLGKESLAVNPIHKKNVFVSDNKLKTNEKK